MWWFGNTVTACLWFIGCWSGILMVGWSGCELGATRQRRLMRRGRLNKPWGL